MWPFCKGNIGNISENSVAYFSLCNLYGIVIKINCIICQITVLKALQLSHMCWNFQFLFAYTSRNILVSCDHN